MEQSISQNDKRFYSVLTIAVIALVVGTAGLAVGLMRPQTPSALPTAINMPSGGSGNSPTDLPPGVDTSQTYPSGAMKSGTSRQ